MLHAPRYFGPLGANTRLDILSMFTREASFFAMPYYCLQESYASIIYLPLTILREMQHFNSIIIFQIRSAQVKSHFHTILYLLYIFPRIYFR